MSNTLRWVKASERLPEKEMDVVIKHYGKLTKLGCLYSDRMFHFYGSTDYLDSLHYKNIEWLDEQPLPEQDELWRKIRYSKYEEFDKLKQTYTICKKVKP